MRFDGLPEHPIEPCRNLGFGIANRAKQPSPNLDNTLDAFLGVFGV